MNSICIKEKLHYAVIGDPIEHSRSPELYAPMFKAFKIDADFLRIRVEDIRTIRSVVKRYSLNGFAVTMPHKKAVINELDKIERMALLSGAVNIVTMENGLLIGHNTDGMGLVNAIKAAGASIFRKIAVILGGGGAASAAKTFLEEAGCRVFLIKRVHSDSGVSDIETEIDKAELQSALISNADFLINATPLGMIGAPGFKDLSFLSQLKRNCIVFDMVYLDGAETPLISKARERGLTTFSGDRLLFHQGQLAFKLWTGFEYGADDSRNSK